MLQRTQPFYVLFLSEWKAKDYIPTAEQRSSRPVVSANARFVAKKILQD